MSFRFLRVFFASAICCSALVACSPDTESPPKTALENTVQAQEQIPAAGDVLYAATFADQQSATGWRMEGNAVVEFRDGWMEMYSPDKSAHHVFWGPEDFPDNFVATWQVQNLAIESGLLIVFFAATGENGEDIFDPALPVRDGTFDQYTEGKIKSYHLSYYANVAHEPGRSHVNLRKNNTFSLLQSGGEGIPTESVDIHNIRLIKQGAHIRLWVDDRKAIDYVDNQPIVDGVDTGAAFGSGKIGLRQMQWSHFRYRNFEVRALANE